MRHLVVDVAHDAERGRSNPNAYVPGADVGRVFLDLDVHVMSSVPPEMGFVGRDVIGEEPLDGRAAGGESRTGPVSARLRGQRLALLVDRAGPSRCLLRRWTTLRARGCEVRLAPGVSGRAPALRSRSPAPHALTRSAGCASLHQVRARCPMLSGFAAKASVATHRQESSTGTGLAAGTGLDAWEVATKPIQTYAIGFSSIGD